MRLNSREPTSRLELEHILNQEELFLVQKSRSEWLSNDDRNTTFFHRRTLKRIRHNKIEALLIEGLSWCFDNEML